MAYSIMTLWPLVRSIGSAGFRMDRERLVEIQAGLTLQLDALAASMKVPQEALPVERREYKGRAPKEIRCPECKGTGMWVQRRKTAEHMRGHETLNRECLEKLATTGKPCCLYKAPVSAVGEASCLKCRGAGGDLSYMPFHKKQYYHAGWHYRPLGGGNWTAERPLPFNPNSPQQIKALFAAFKVRLPRAVTTSVRKDPETTAEKQLQPYAKMASLRRIAPGLDVGARRRFADLIAQVLEYKKLHKRRSRIGEYMPGEDGRTRCDLSFSPASWRLAGKMQKELGERRAGWANLLNVDKEGELRTAMLPDEGEVLMEIDNSSIEALIAGKLAGDEEFMRACRFSIHAILASYRSSQPVDLATWSDSDIKDMVGYIKAKQAKLYDKCKRVVYLSLYGGTARMIRSQYPLDFEGEKEAEALQRLFFETLGRKLWDWQLRELWEAHSKGFLETAAGYRRCFYDIYRDWWMEEHVALHFLGRYNPAARRKWGQDAKSALDYRPQNLAAHYLYEQVSMVAEREPELFRRYRITVYDSHVWSLRPGQAERARREVAEMLSFYCPEIGLRVPNEAKAGANWKEME